MRSVPGGRGVVTRTKEGFFPIRYAIRIPLLPYRDICALLRIAFEVLRCKSVLGGVFL